MLNDLITDYQRTQKAWQDKTAVDDTEAGCAAEWDAYEAAEAALLSYPCLSLHDVRTKVAFVLATDSAFDTVQNGHEVVDEEQIECLETLLRSLLGEASS